MSTTDRVIAGVLLAAAIFLFLYSIRMLAEGGLPRSADDRLRMKRRYLGVLTAIGGTALLMLCGGILFRRFLPYLLAILVFAGGAVFAYLYRKALYDQPDTQNKQKPNDSPDQ